MMIPKRARYRLLILVVLAIAARLVFCYILYPHFLVPFSTVGSEYFFDSYREIAENLLTDEGFVLDSGVPVIHRPPGYVLVLLVSVPTNTEVSRFLFQLWNALFGGVAVFLTYRLALATGTSEPFALAAGSVVALWPFSVWETKVTVPENVLVALIPGLALLLLRLHRTPSPKLAALVGLVGGAATLLHATYQVLLVLIPAVLLLVRTQRLKRVLPAFLLAFACVVGPWVVRNAVVSGYAGISAGFGLHYFKGVYAFNQLLQGKPYFKDHDIPATEWVSELLAGAALGPIVTNEARSDPARNNYLDRAAVRHLVGTPVYTTAKVLAKVPLAWVHQQNGTRSLLTAVLLLPLVILLVLNGRHLLEPDQAILLGLMLGINMAVALVFTEAIPMRYVLPLMPLLAVLAMEGLSRFFSKTVAGGPRHRPDAIA